MTAINGDNIRIECWITTELMIDASANNQGDSH